MITNNLPETILERVTEVTIVALVDRIADKVHDRIEFGRKPSRLVHRVREVE